MMCPIGFLVFFILYAILILWIVFYKRECFKKEKELPPFYCINIETDEVRRKHIEKHFSKFNVEIIPAVDTRNNKWKNYKHHLTRDALVQVERAISNTYRIDHHELTQGAIGCFLSHMKCWKLFLERHDTSKEDKCLFVLEDDAVPKDEFEPMLRKVLKNLPKDADIVLFSHVKSGPEEKIKVAEDLELLKLKEDAIFYLLNAYLIRASAIKKIFKHLRNRGMRFDKQVDSYMTHLMQMGLVNVYTTIDSVCPQIYVTSTSIQTIKMYE